MSAGVSSSVEAPGRRQDLLAIALLTVLGAVIRFATLDARSLWLDEALTIVRTRPPLGEVVTASLTSSAHPPAYFVLVKGWMEVFGSGEVGLRSLSALLGTATIPVMYAIGRELGGVRVGRIAALLTALSPPLVWLSQDGRPYALLVLAIAASFLFFVRALREPSGSNLAGWGVASALALLSHYFALFIVVVEGLWLLARHRFTRPLIIAGAGLAAVMAALAPSALAPRGTAGWILGSPLALRVARIPAEFAAGFQPPWEIAAAALTTALAALAFAFLLHGGSSRERRAARIPILVGVGALALPVALALAGFDRVYPRHLVAAWVPLGVAAALGFGVRRHARASAVALAALSLVWVGIHVATFNDPKFGHQDWRGATRSLPPATVARALVVAPPGRGAPLTVYLGAREMGPSGASVTHLALIGLPSRERRPGQAPRPPRAPARAPVAGFREVSRTEDRDFTTVSYRARRPVRLTPADLEYVRFGRDGVIVMIQPPAPAGRR